MHSSSLGGNGFSSLLTGDHHSAPAAKPVLLNKQAWAAMGEDSTADASANDNLDPDFERFQRQREEQLERERLAQEQQREREAKEEAKRKEAQERAEQQQR